MQMCKKMMTAALLLQCTTQAHADVLAFKSFLDAGLFSTEMTGDVMEFSTSTMPLYTLGFAFEHPVPVLPNFLVKADMGSRDISDLSDKGFGFYKQDYILYYELLDNKYVDIDIGAGYSMGQLKLEDQRLASPSSWVSYFDTRFFINDFFAFFDGEIGLEGHDYYDSQAGLGWRFGTGFDLNLTLAYRMIRTLDEPDSKEALMKTSGVVLGLELAI